MARARRSGSLELHPATGFLRACARVELGEQDRTRVQEAAASVRDWRIVIDWAENHNLIPLVWHHSRACDVAIPDKERRRLGVLVCRHRDLNRVQMEVLNEIVQALQAHGIEHLVLKGAVLAHALYARPDLRPMLDLDILVWPRDAGRAQALLADLGFDAPQAPVRPAARLHHHLPIAACRRDGQTVNVEIHRDALSGDQPGSLGLAGLSQPPRVIAAGQARFRSFGHVDMLRHLCAHVLEPGVRTRLIGVADFVGYAARFAGEIDWGWMRRRHARVVNALALMHYLTPLPGSLERLRPSPDARVPCGVGEGFAPLSTIARRTGVGGAFGDLLYPPEWWMRAYYGVPPHRPLFPVRWSRHLRRLASWGMRRALAASGPHPPA
jgi:hypothetical protein